MQKYHDHILHNKKSGDMELISLSDEQADFFELLVAEDLIRGLEFDYELIDLRDMKRWIPPKVQRRG